MGNNGSIFLNRKGGVMVNSRLLRKIVKENGLKIRELARLGGMRMWVLTTGILGWREFKLWEIERLSKVLGIDENLVGQIFFAEKVS